MKTPIVVLASNVSVVVFCAASPISANRVEVTDRILAIAHDRHIHLNESAFSFATELIEQRRFLADLRNAWGEHQPSTEDENTHYGALSERISAVRRSQIGNLRLNPPSLTSIAETDFAAMAQSLMFPSGNDALVSIVIPVFNNLKYTLECLMSVMMYSYGVPYEVIVVDDASTDKTEEVLADASNLIYIRNEKNLGFVHSCNRGAEGANGKFLLFLNNDTQVTENWLRPLVDTFTEYQGVGAVGPKILFPDGRLQEAGTLVNRDGTSRLIGVFDNPNLPRYNYVREVMYCSGACLMVEARNNT